MSNEFINNEFDVCIAGGLGHVGLPFGLALANANKKVILFDINTKTIEKVSSGEMPFKEEGAEEILKKVLNKNLFITDSPVSITKSKYLVVIIGTPVDEHLNPMFDTFLNFFDGIYDYIKDGQHIILRSTVYPGTTQKICEILKSKGKNINISFCPERIAEGKAIEELHSLPQIVSAFDDKAFEEAKSLFLHLTPDIIRLEPLEAELAKLITNTWRYLTFAISNQFYQITTQQNIDFYKIYDAITYKYPRLQGLPKPGFAAGPCLFKDTMQLSAFSNNSFFLGHAGMLINEGLPNFIVKTLKEKYNLKDKTVGILGMAFKANSDDKRESLSYKLKKMLQVEANKVLCSDIYIKEKDFVDVSIIKEKCEIIILGAPHQEYKDLKFPDDKIIVDVWNFWNKGGLF